MSFRDISSLAFAIGAQRVGMAMTEMTIHDRDLVEARDPLGLTPIDATRTLGLPPKLRITASGRAAYIGDAETARKVLVAAGMLEAPLAVMPDGIVYADRFGTGGIRPNERMLHAWRDGRLMFLGRFPGEEDRFLGQGDLPDNLRPHFPHFDGWDGFACVQDENIVSEWLAQTAQIPRVE